jgi:hypothetical protein
MITGVVVSYNGKSMLEKSYTSVRKFLPDIPIIIIDGSDKENPCSEYVCTLNDKNCFGLTLYYNIGHGRGMCVGLYYVKTRYALIFDSDIEMKDDPIPKMLSLMEADTFGVGEIMKVNNKGLNSDTGIIPYLHPYFQIIDVLNYRRYYPYVHHGAPCIKTMKEIFKKGLSNKILKTFPVRKYVEHSWEGTRSDNIRRGMREIELGWED